MDNQEFTDLRSWDSYENIARAIEAALRLTVARQTCEGTPQEGTLLRSLVADLRSLRQRLLNCYHLSQDTEGRDPTDPYTAGAGNLADIGLRDLHDQFKIGDTPVGASKKVRLLENRLLEIGLENQRLRQQLGAVEEALPHTVGTPADKPSRIARLIRGEKKQRVLRESTEDRMLQHEVLARQVRAALHGGVL